MSDSETVAALKRAGMRAAFHLLKAGVESLKAVEAVLEELGRVRRGEADPDAADDGDDRRPVRIEIE